MTWLEEFRCDGLRFDATVFIRHVRRQARRPGGRPPRRLVVHGLAQRRDPRAPAVEDHDRRGPPGRPLDGDAHGGGWRRLQRPVGPVFVYDVRPALAAHDDADRDVAAVAAAILGEGRGAPWTRVIYTESHDDVANGSVRVPESISPGDADSWWATKRAVLGSALVLTSPGIPMLFQGQELLEDSFFDDTVPPRLGQGHLEQRDPAPAPRPDRAAPGEGRGDARPRRPERAHPPGRQRRQGPGDAPLAGRRAARRHRGRRQLRGPHHRRPADRPPGAGSLERAAEPRLGGLRAASSGATR